MAGTLILVVGPSGVGKDTLLDGARHLLRCDSRFHFVRRDITRSASAIGEDHNALSNAEFVERLARGEYALHWGAHDLLYGLSHAELSALEHGKSVIANGSRSVLGEARETFKPLAILSVTADETLLRQRLEARGREDSSDIERRIERAKAFNVTGDDVLTICNNGSVKEGVAQTLEGLARIDGRVFGQCPPGDAPVPRPGAYLISRRGDDVLFVKTGAYSLPGGGLEGDERAEEALRREVLEETGCVLTTEPVQLCDASVFGRGGDLKPFHKLQRYFLADVEERCAPSERDHVPMWMNPKQIWEKLPPDVQYALTQLDQRGP